MEKQKKQTKSICNIKQLETKTSNGRQAAFENITKQSNMSSVLRSECLLLIAAACNSEVGAGLARKELTSMMDKKSMVKEQDVRRVILSMAKKLMK